MKNHTHPPSAINAINMSAEINQLINSDDEYEDVSDSESSHSDEFSESLVDRLAALKDAFPIELQYSMLRSFNSTFRLAKNVAMFMGKAGWVITTATALLLLPGAMELEREHAMFLQESQMRGSLSQADVRL
jgi:hypothetical protein